MGASSSSSFKDCPYNVTQASIKCMTYRDFATRQNKKKKKKKEKKKKKRKKKKKERKKKESLNRI